MSRTIDFFMGIYEEDSIADLLGGSVMHKMNNSNEVYFVLPKEEE